MRVSAIWRPKFDTRSNEIHYHLFAAFFLPSDRDSDPMSAKISRHYLRITASCFLVNKVTKKQSYK